MKRLSRILAQPDASWAEIGRRVCDAFGFVDLHGRPQVTSCLSALRRLERAGRIALPAPCRSGGRGTVARSAAAVPEPVGLPASAGAVVGLDLVRVEGSALRLVFNELMASEHPRSARLHVGRQLRYLVGSSHGWLGGILFAPATRVLAARDAWLGWDDASRARHLDRVIGLARFLIRPSVSVRGLASRSRQSASWSCRWSRTGRPASRRGVRWRPGTGLTARPGRRTNSARRSLATPA